MKHVLFVDDEKHILEGIRLALFEHEEEWEMSFALGVEPALRLIEKQTFDAIVSDMRMPSMDGATLLERVRVLHPGMVRVILSGQAEHANVVRALAVAHQFLHKPCNAQVLFNTVQRIFELREMLADPRLETLLGKLEVVPSPPATYFEITRLMDRAESSANDFAAVIERDGAMSAKVLQMVNSAYFRSQREVTSIRQAVVHLGLETLRAMVLGSHLLNQQAPRASARFNLEAAQARAQQVAQRARDLAPRAHGEAAFAAGLLHNLGYFALALGTPESYGALLDETGPDAAAIEKAERERIGVTREQLGAYLLGIWGLPTAIVEAVAFQRAPTRAPNPDAPALIAVHGATHLPAVDDANAGRIDVRALLDPQVLARPAWREAIAQWEQTYAARGAAMA